MSHYVVQALLDGNIMFHRETPLESGVENLINEGLSMLLATTGGAPGRDAFVEVLRYYDTDPIPEVDLIIFADEVSEVFFEAESLTKTKGKVRTMSGKPHKVRKLKQDQGITPEEAARRISLKSETHVFDADTMEWDIDYLESYETPYGTKLDGVLYNPTTGESAEFEGITIETSIPDIDPLYANMEDIPTYEAENEDNLGPMFMAEEKKNCGCGQDPCKTYGAESFAAYEGDIFTDPDYYSMYYGAKDKDGKSHLSDNALISHTTSGLQGRPSTQRKTGEKSIYPQETVCGMKAGKETPLAHFGGKTRWNPKKAVKALEKESNVCKKCLSHAEKQLWKWDAETFEADTLCQGHQQGGSCGEKSTGQCMNCGTPMCDEMFDYCDGEWVCYSCDKMGFDPNEDWDAETFEAPKTMTKTQAKKKFLAILKPYWLKALKNQRGPKLTHKQHLATLDDPDDDYYGMYEEDWDWWNNHVKTVQSGAYGPASPSGDTILRERLPHTYYDFIDNIAGAVPDELEEKYSYDNGYDTGNIYYELCIVDGEPDADNFSAADKRKLAALEKRYDKDLITSDVFFATQEAIFSKYDKQVVHRDSASAAKCRHCGPYIKAMNNTNNWDWEYLDDYDDFWNECKREKIPDSELKPLTNIILGKAKLKPKPKAKKTTTRKSKPKATKKTTRKASAKKKTGRKAPTISATKRKIGTRMRGNDGKMWQVKKSGKSQRWMAGAETQTQTFHSSIDSKFDELL